MYKAVRTKYGSLRAAFRAMDRNFDGVLAPEELRAGLKNLGVELTPIQLEQLVKSCDINGDGFVEFRDWSDLFSLQEL